MDSLARHARYLVRFHHLEDFVDTFATVGDLNVIIFLDANAKVRQINQFTKTVLKQVLFYTMSLS